jgi:hypothetical protein
MALLRRSLVTGVHINRIRIMVLHWRIYVFCTANRKDYFELLFFNQKAFYNHPFKIFLTANPANLM